MIQEARNWYWQAYRYRRQWRAGRITGRQAARQMAADVLIATGLCRLLTFSHQGYRLRFYPSHISRQLWCDPASRDETKEYAFLRRYLRTGDHVIDVGANVGTMTLLVAHLIAPGGEVLAFEAHPKTYGYLAGNVALNRLRNVRLYNVALGEKTGEIRFSDRIDDDRNQIEKDAGIVVPLHRLDDLCGERIRRRARIALIKIDVEGYEKFVFEGASDMLALTDCIHFEAEESLYANFGYDFAAVRALLSQAGFSLWRFAEAGALASLATDYSPVRLENLLAVRDMATFQKRAGYRLDAI